MCVDIHILAEVAIAFDCSLFHTDQFFVGEAGFFLYTECGPVSFDLRAVVYVMTKPKTSIMFLKILIVAFSHTFSLTHRIHHWQYIYQSADLSSLLTKDSTSLFPLIAKHSNIMSTNLSGYRGPMPPSPRPGNNEFPNNSTNGLPRLSEPSSGSRV